MWGTHHLPQPLPTTGTPPTHITGLTTRASLEDNVPTWASARNEMTVMSNEGLPPVPIAFVEKFIADWKAAAKGQKGEMRNICLYNAHGTSEMLEYWKKANGLPSTAG